MMWCGYAAARLGINVLKPFQIETLAALKMGKDVAIVQSTSSGKSLCFQVLKEIFFQNNKIDFHVSFN